MTAQPTSKDQTAAVRETLDELIDRYRADCFLAKDAGLDRSVNMLALATVNLKDDIERLITANYTPNAEVAEREQLARVDENESLLDVAEHEIELGDKCYNHEKHTPACYACRKRKMYVEYSKDWKSSIDERLAQLSKEES